MTLLSFTSDWTKYTAEKGQFKVLVPATMEVQYDTINANIGTIFSQNYYCKSIADTTETLFTITYLDYPQYTLHEDSTELVEMYFQATVDNIVAELKGKLMYESKDATASNPTYIWKILYDNEQKSAKFKCIIIGNKIYILRVSELNKPDKEKKSQRFLDSFKYIKAD